MKKTINIFVANAINVFFGVLFLVMCGYIVTPQYKFLHAGGLYFTPYKVIIFAVLITAFFILSLKNIPKKRIGLFLQRHNTAMLASVLGSLFVVQFLVMYTSATQIGFDCGVIVNIAAQKLTKDVVEYCRSYIMVYPNNMMIVLILKLWWNITRDWLFKNIWLASITLNIIFVDIAILLVCKTAQKLFAQKGLYTALFFAVPVLGLSPYILVPYSDTMVTPFLAGFIYTVVCFWKSTGNKKFLFACEAGFLIIIGYTIKPTIIIPGIASFVIAIILAVARKITWKNIAVYSCCFALGTSVILGLNLLKYSLAPKEEWENKAMPMTHFLMMGLSNGAYDHNDVLFTKSYSTKSEKQQANLQVIRERLNTRWNDGTLWSHFLYKGTWSFIDGTFFYGGEGSSHYGAEKAQEGITGLLQNFTYVETEFYQNWYCNYLQAWWLIMGALMASYLVQSPRKIRLNLVSILQLSVIGLWIFLMLFECRSRYIFPFIPVFLTLTIIRIIQIDRFVTERKKCNEQHH